MRSAMTLPVGFRAISGFKWAGLSMAANLMFQLGLTAAMARMLAPATFGLMAMAMVVLRFFSYFSQMGMGAALVQKEKLDPQDIRCALGLTWLVCLAVILLIVATAPLVGWFFHNDQVVPLVRVLSLNLLLLGLGAVPMALLRRALRFREVALVETISYVSGYGLVGVGAALAGAGIWSLVAATFGQSLIVLIGAYAFTRHPLRPSLRGDRARLLDYGTRHSLISFLEFLSANLDSAIIGRFLGEGALGLYNRALLLTNLPIERMAGIISRVLFPILSGVQQDRRKVGNVYLLGISLIGLVGGAVSAGISAAASDIVRILLGPRWGDSVPVVEILALSVPFMFMSNIAGVVCDASALLRFKLKVQSLGLGVIAGLMLLLYPLGVTGIAWAIVVGEGLRFAVYVLFLSRHLRCEPADVAKALGSVLAVSAAAYAGIHTTIGITAEHAVPILAALAIEIAVGLIVLLAGAYLWTRLMAGSGPETLARNHIPGWRRLSAALAGNEKRP